MMLSKSNVLTASLLALVLFTLEAFLMMVLLYAIKDISDIENPVRPVGSKLIDSLAQPAVFYTVVLALLGAWIFTWFKAKKSAWHVQRGVLHLPFMVILLCALGILLRILFAPVLQQ